MLMFKSGLCQLAASVTHDSLISFAFSQYRCQHLITLTFSCATKYMYLDSSLTHFILVDCSTVIYVGQVHLLF